MVKPEPSLIKVEDITHPDPKNNLIFAEDLYFKLNCHKTTEYFKLLLFPDHIKDYIEYRKILTDGKTMYLYTYTNFVHILDIHNTLIHFKLILK